MQQEAAGQRANWDGRCKHLTLDWSLDIKPLEGEKTKNEAGNCIVK